jgi:hypothetical protein
MDDLERRLSALEMLFVKTGQWLEPGALDEIRRSIEADIAAASDPEVVEAGRRALAMVDAAHRRIRPKLPDEPWRRPGRGDLDGG